jgi:hypothetical protein
MERLTMRSPIGGSCVLIKNKSSYKSICLGCEKIGNCRRKCFEEKALEKLAEYEDLEEQCFLVRLPCKLGDTVYTTDFGAIQSQKIGRIIISEDGVWLYDNHYKIIGAVKDVFFTKSEAEQALAKIMEETQNVQ